MDDDLVRAVEILTALPASDRALALEVLAHYRDHSAQGGPFTWLLGLKFDEIQPGFARCHLDVTRLVHNPGGIAHGAIAYTLLDSAMGAAFYQALERPLTCSTIELKVNYLRPVVSGQLFASAELVERTRRFGILTGRVVDADGRLIALAQATFAVVGM